MKTWKISDEILAASHRWYEIILFTLVGALLGWGISYLWPSPYRATVDLYVGLNAYRSPYDSYVANVAQQEFRMVDDYKNWQMRQLNELILTDAYLSETLNQLQGNDPYWNDIGTQDLREKFAVMWRNAGEWHLMADGDKEYIIQAVQTWREVIVENVNEAISHAQNVVALDIQMTELAENSATFIIRQAELTYIFEQLTIWQAALQNFPDDDLLTSADHWQILGWVSQAMDWSPVWKGILNNAPELDSPASEYRQWLEGVLILMDEELALLPNQIALLEGELKDIEKTYLTETEQSKALASTLVVENVSDEKPRVTRLRPTGLMTMIGFFIGLIAWVFLTFTRISLRKESA